MNAPDDPVGDKNGAREYKYRVECLPRIDGVLALLGWRYRVTLFAWDDEEQRFRPAPMSVPGGHLFGWQRRARSEEAADALALHMAATFRLYEEQEQERLAAMKWGSA